MTTGKTIGAVFPINSSQASRFFDEGRRVFVKFTNMSNFKTNSKIVFYVTKEKVLVGEGTIKTVQRMLNLPIIRSITISFGIFSPNNVLSFLT
jgi:hypothetical protein